MTNSENSETSTGPANNENSSKFVFHEENLKRYQFPTHINDLVIDRADSRFSEVFMVIIEPDKAPVYHKHDDTEQVFYIISGSGVLTIGEDRQQFPVQPGDVVRIPVSTLHSIRADSTHTLNYLCVDCFGERPKLEPTWDDHVKTVCKENGWDYHDVVSK
jgi:mannose-6-phosphate isomerase-like protein (cupin superfamily)